MSCLVHGCKMMKRVRGVCCIWFDYVVALQYLVMLQYVVTLRTPLLTSCIMIISSCFIGMIGSVKVR